MKAASVSKEWLTQMLVETGKLDKQKLAELTEEAKSKKFSVFQLIKEKEIVREEEMIDFYSEYLGIPTLPLSSLRITKETSNLLPQKIITKYKIFPIARIRNVITVVTSDPFEIMYRNDIKDITRCDVVPLLATSKAITALSETQFGEAANIDTILEEIAEEEIEIVQEQKDGKGKKIVPDAPVVRLVNLILNQAIQSRASDIHFEPYEKMFRVRYRIDGSLKEVYSHSRDTYSAITARIKIMSNLNITERRLPQDGRFRVKIQDREIDLRVSILPMYFGEKMVVRILDRGGLKNGLDKLGFTPASTQIFAEAIRNPYGMILVTGPTGSGKSTTLYTILNTMNTPERNLMTIEDPVEFQVEGITQTQTNADVGLTFASGLRALLRQSPDIVLVGEIRDKETADIAVKAALTGHLVFSTLHTNSAAGAMTRLLDMGVEPFLIASSMVCVAAQRLMRRVCQYCKEPYQVPEEVLRRCNLTKKDIESFTPQKGAGCAKCFDTGYFGRLAAIEILKMSPAIRNLVIQKKSTDEIAQTGKLNGMETLFENAFGLFKSGHTTLEEVLRVTSGE